MRIGVVTNSFLPAVGGLEWKVHYLATENVKRGHDTVVFAGRRPYTFGTPRIPVEPKYQLVRCSYTLPGFRRFGLALRLMRAAILRHHRKEPFDVLHCHHLGLATQVGSAVKKVTGLPVVGTTCGRDVQVLPDLDYGDRLIPRLDRVVRDNLDTIDVVGSISSSVRTDLEDLKPRAQIVDIPNGVVWDSFQKQQGRAFRAQLGLDDAAVLVLSVGRNHIKKGYRHGIAAFAKVARKHRNVHYAIVGRNGANLERAVSEVGMEGRVRIVGQLPMTDLPDVYHSADIFFNPSLIEGFAQVNAQALACGLPLVLTDAPGNIDAGKNGGALIARSGDEDSMAKALSELVEDRSLRHQLGRQAHAASHRYSWSRIAEEYLQVFGALVGHDKGPRSAAFQIRSSSSIGPHEN